MCQNAANADGTMGDYHFAHLSQFALGGAGLIFIESTAVERSGRINEHDVGLWHDDHIGAIRRVADFVHGQGAALGLQISHAGWKAGAAPLCDGGKPLPREDLIGADGVGFTRVGPSAISPGAGWTVPETLNIEGITKIKNSFREAVRRANEARIDVIELHYAHGYLVASFLSPYSNRRADQYGGSLENRMRLAVEIAQETRSVWPASKPLFCRLSVEDGIEGGWNEEDSIILAQRLKLVGVDVIDCSSGGLRDATKTATVPRDPGFQVPYARRLRSEANVMTQAVGMILTPEQAEDVLVSGAADLVAIGRQALFNPYWPRHAAQRLAQDPDFKLWPRYNGAYLAKRSSTLPKDFNGVC
jgi:2,4-dienoyl-CoA reductase-like NADH-dependent reductase (Old Yellow Enzyme family)